MVLLESLTDAFLLSIRQILNAFTCEYSWSELFLVRLVLNHTWPEFPSTFMLWVIVSLIYDRHLLHLPFGDGDLELQRVMCECEAGRLYSCLNLFLV